MADKESQYWTILGIAPTRDQGRIREAYLTQVRRHHPDQYRANPIVYQQKEEYMKEINAAYDWALRHPPVEASRQQTARPTPEPDEPVVCPVHKATALGRCKRCQQPICLACLGVRQSLCNKHYTQLKENQARRRALTKWGPLAGLIILFGALGLPGRPTLVAVALYVAYLGFRLLLDKHWWGCLTILLFPYSLLLAGIWSLIESLHDSSKGSSS